MNKFQFNLRKFNPLIVIFPIFLPFVTIILSSCLVGLFDNFLLLFFKAANLSYEKYSSITKNITSFLPLGYGLIPLHFVIAYFFYPLQKKWLRDVKIKKVAQWIVFLWWFLSGILINGFLIVFSLAQ